MISKENSFACVLMAAAFLAVSSCGTKKNVVGSSSTAAVTGTNSTTAKKDDAADRKLQQINYLRKVSDNAIYQKNITSKIKVTINTGGNDISVAGQLRMRRDEVIRIQITPLGLMEAGRLEFGKDYVLLVDRIHKQYVKAAYKDVDFLQRNGLDFYALQALFWNELFVPGMQKVTDSSLNCFNAELGGTASVTVSLQSGKMKYVWQTEPKTALVKSVNAKYSATDGGASVNCQYSDFRALGVKKFPCDIMLTMSTKAIRNADKMSLRLQLSSLGSDSDWDSETQVSSKYKQVSVADILGSLTSL